MRSVMLQINEYDDDDDDDDIKQYNIAILPILQYCIVLYYRPLHYILGFYEKMGHNLVRVRQNYGQPFLTPYKRYCCIV